MLTDTAQDVALRLRRHVGSDQKGVGPDISQLLRLFDDLHPADLRDALDDLESLGFIQLDKGIPASPTGTPRELKAIAGLRVLEPLQSYFDDLSTEPQE